MKLSFFAPILFLANTCSKKKHTYKDTDLTEFYTYTQTDTSKYKEGATTMYMYKVRRFYVDPFINYNDHFFSAFAAKRVTEIDSPFKDIHIIIYKKSSITNIEHLSKFPRDLDRHSQNNDMLYIFSTSTFGNRIYMTKYKNGESIYPNDDIKVTPIKQ